MSNVPTNLIPSTITQLPDYSGTSTLGYFAYALEGRTYKVQFSQLAAVGAVPSTRVIGTGNGLQGGGDLSQDRVISIIPHGVGYSQLDFTGVTAGTYGSANTVPSLTIDATGRVTAAVDTPIVLSDYVPSSRTVTAGAGLTGGGQLNNNITIALNPSNATPQSLGAASAGTGTQAARDDHVHPAVDLTDTSETQGVLPLGRGGTGVALSPVVGAVIYADNDSLNQTAAGNVGQVLTSAGGLGAPYWQTISGTGTVTSVNASGGTTGLTFTGGPITTSGTLTLGGTLAVANGGTGASVAGTARTNLGAAASGANTDITSIALTTGTVSATPTGGTDLVNKAYADSIASGINFHQSVRLATAAALPANTYNNGSSGVGATLTANANGALSVDGVAAVAGNRILVKDEVAQANNGVYTVTQVGDGSTPYILTRATDFDSAGTGVDQIDAGDFFLVTAGSTQSNTSWVQQTPLPITVGTTAIVFTQFAAPVLYSAGTGLTLAGTVFSITNTGVSASTYGSASSVPVLAINAQGQITSASASSIAIAASQVTSGTFTVGQGGTGATTLGANGVLLGNGTSAISATAVGATGQVLIGNTGAAPTWAALSGIGVTSFSGGTTGLTPASATTGAITLAGTLNVANGGTGTATAFTAGSVVFAGASGVYTQDNANLFWDNTNGRLGIGTSSPEGVFHVQYTGGGAAIVRRYSTDANAANVNLQKSRGTSASPTIVASGDIIGNLSFQGYDGSAFRTAAAIYGEVDGTPGSTDMPGRLTFLTSLDGSATPTERMRITNAGYVGIGTSAPSSSQILTLSSSGTATPANGGLAGLGIINTDVTASGTTGILGNLTDPGGTGRHAGAIAFGKDGTWTTGSAYPGNIQFWTRPNSTASEAERMRIDSSGNVGIGTGAPASLLHVKQSSDAIEVYPSGTWAGRVINAADAAGYNGLVVGNRWASTNSWVVDFGSIYGNNSGTWSSYYKIDGVGQSIWGSGPAGTERMRLDTSGNFGIGTSSPGSKLDVVAQDAIRATGFQPFLTLRDSSDSNKGSRIQTASAITIFYNDTTGGGTYTERMRINSSGFVGIGTSAPQVGLHVSFADQSTNRVRLQNTGSGGGNFDIIGGLAGASNAGLSFFDVTNSATRMYIDSSGNVGIGTSSPANLLEVRGAVTTTFSPNVYNTVLTGTSSATSGNAGCGISFRGYTTGTSGISDLAFISGIKENTTDTNYAGALIFGTRTNGSGGGSFERMRITSAGYLLVGTTTTLGGNTSNEFKTTTAGSWPLTLNANDRGLLIRQSAASSGIYAYFEYNGGTNNGQISWSGGTTSYTTTSDARVKKNIVDAPDAGALIDAIKVRSWDFKVDDMHWRYGMVAQELLPVAPEAVTVPEDEEMMMGVDYAKLVPMLIKEVQSLRARVAQLEGN